MNAPHVHCLALLRGINVGGRNIIRMADLRSCFEEHGLGDVATYIQSGNVLFSAPSPDGERMEAELEALLAATFDYGATVVLRTRDELRAVVARAPEGFGEEPETYRYDVIFLKPPLTAAEAMETVPRKEGVDEAHAGEGVLYFSRLTERASQSRLSRLTSLPVYQSMTIRNWNTTTKLLSMLEAR